MALEDLHAVRVYTLDGIKDGKADFDGTGPVPVYTLDGTVRIRVKRTWALYKMETGQDFYAC